MSPYCRPAPYADAVVVIDSLLWWETEPSIIALARPETLGDDEWRSLLARAFTFRLLAFDEAGRRPSRSVTDELDRYERVVSHLRLC
jgi:hypothetical protein